MPELQHNTFQKRQVAYKVRIVDILNNLFVKDALSAGYAIINKINVLRVNIIATIVFKSEDLSYANVVIDDGTGRLALRSFENKEIFSMVDVGDFVLVIGRIREFNNEKYITPEILRKVDNFQWIDVRRMEFEKVAEQEIFENTSKKLEQEIFENGNEEVYLLIKKLDNGDGAPIEELVKKCSNSKAEDIINKLLENGSIFEVKPGKLKVLE
ncbi:hypothetical protein HYY70_06395 [Candidatus Woesearchaeota archaeon]|nr:hypothetical protein [Candidatus Woesearchaeota archaeon]